MFSLPLFRFNSSFSPFWRWCYFLVTFRFENFASWAASWNNVARFRTFFNLIIFEILWCITLQLVMYTIALDNLKHFSEKIKVSFDLKRKMTKWSWMSVTEVHACLSVIKLNYWAYKTLCKKMHISINFKCVETIMASFVQFVGNLNILIIGEEDKRLFN